MKITKEEIAHRLVYVNDQLIAHGAMNFASMTPEQKKASVMEQMELTAQKTALDELSKQWMLERAKELIPIMDIESMPALPQGKGK